MHNALNITPIAKSPNLTAQHYRPQYARRFKWLIIASYKIEIEKQGRICMRR